MQLSITDADNTKNDKKTLDEHKPKFIVSKVQIDANLTAPSNHPKLDMST